MSLVSNAEGRHDRLMVHQNHAIVIRSMS